MSDFLTKVTTWVKANLYLAIGIALTIIILLFGRSLKRLFGVRRRVRHRRPAKSIRIVRRSPGLRAKNRKPLPRSVGMSRASGRGYPKYGGGYIPFKRNKNGSIKKAKFVSGTVAAHNYMRKLRLSR